MAALVAIDEGKNMFKSTSLMRSNPGGGQGLENHITFKTKAISRGCGKRAVLVNIPNKVAGEARFLKGDRIDVLVNESERQILLSPVTHEGGSIGGHGWKLGQHRGVGGLKFEYTEFDGCVSVDSKFKGSIIKKYEVTQDGILIYMPESLTVKH